MNSIFFDLETSDQECIGQILNYSFMAVDDTFQVVDELNGDILISRLQLPRAGAILANRVDVLQHQRRTKESEYVAMERIGRWVESLIQSNDGRAVPLVGFNSNRFDVPFLRTSFIRNGFSPYFFGRIINRDLLLLVRKLSCSDARFPRPESASEKGKLSLRLESLCQHFGLLDGAQQHESSADVRLTIALAQTIQEMFQVDVRRFDPYEGGRFHSRAFESEPVVVSVREPQYELTSDEIFRRKYLGLLSAEARGAALWVDLLRYRDGAERKAVEWYKGGVSPFFLEEEVRDSELLDLAQKAREEFRSLTPENFFPASTCDIEQDIYRAHGEEFKTLNSLAKAIKDGDRSLIEGSASEDAKVLLTRFRLREYQRSGDRAELSFQKALRQYAEYRYGGKLQLRRTLPEDGEFTKENYFAPTLDQLFQELSTAEKDAIDNADLQLLVALRSFYEDSEIVQALRSSE